MATAQDFVDAARALVGTPQVHQGRQPGVGVDCVGVVVCAMRACGFQVTQDDPRYWSMPREADLMPRLRRQFVRVRRMRPGDVLVFRYPLQARHVAILAEDRHMVSCTSRGVREIPLSDTWRQRISAVFRVKELAA